MCGRYTIDTEDEVIEMREILKLLSLRLVESSFEDNKTQGEFCPGSTAPVLHSGEQGIELLKFKWGFKNQKSMLFNARIESVNQKPTFKDITTNRCVIPASSFFEWKKESGNKTKHAFASDSNGGIQEIEIRPQESGLLDIIDPKTQKHEPLFMAGIYRTNEKGEREFVILTEKADKVMEPIHDRNPVLLKKEEIEDWLNGKKEINN